MLEFFKNLFAWQPFLPHGHCYLWKPGLVELHIVSDSIIALSYYSILITLFYFVRKRQDLPYSWMFLLFSAFIVACGTTHLMEIWTLWYPTYWLSGCLKAITAFVSFLTAVEMLQLVPKALAFPSPAQLEATNQKLEREISERKLAEAALKQAGDELEIKVKERTAQLATANQELRQEISDRKQTQFALQASEGRLKEVLDNTGAFISSGRIHPEKPWEYDYYSPNGENIFGYKGEEFAADPSLWFSRIHAQDIETIILPAMEDLYAERQVTVEYRFRHKNGSWRWLYNTLVAKKYESEDYWFLTGIAIDITKRKQAETALQESEQRFAALAKTAPVGIFRTDIQGNCVYGNERCFDMIGLGPKECIGAGWTTAIHPDDCDSTLAAWLSFVKQGIPYYWEHRFQRPNGSIIWVLGQAIAEKDAEGNIIGYIGTVTEITERKQAEQLLKDYNQVLEFQVQERTAELSQTNTYLELEIEERKEIEAKLRRSEAKLSAILDNAGACIYIKDLNGTYIYVNRLTEEFFGRNESEIIGANDRDFFVEELAETYKENNDQVIKTGVVHRFEEVGIDRQGELHNYLSTKVPLKNSDGDIYAICGISTDITEIKKAEAALRQSEERMQALLRAIPDLMFRHRVDGTYLDIAGNESSLLLPREALIGKKIQDTPIPEPIKTGLLERFRAAVATGTLQIYEHDLEKPDGMHSYETRIMKSRADEVVCLVRDITERKRSQAALEESEERYRTVIAAMAEGIVLQDADGAIQTCNLSAKRILGLSRKQMMGRTSLDPGWRAIREDGSPFPGEEHPAMVTLRTGTACSNVVMGVHKPDESFTWISINSRPLFRAGETVPYAVVASFADITARKQAEEALRQSEARYLAILQDQTELIARALLDGTLTFVNEAFCRFSGKTREELIGSRYEPNVFEEDRENVTRLIKTLSVDNPVVVIENRVIAKGEEVRWTQWINRGIFDEEGRMVEFQGVGRDITERKEIEEVLRESEAMLSNIFDNAGAYIYMKDLNSRYTYVNRPILELFDCSKEEIIGADNFKFFEAETAQRLRESDLQVIESGEVSQSQQVTTVKHSGEVHYYWAVKVPLKRADGSIYALCGISTDITELKRTEEALRHSESTLRSFFDSGSMLMGIVELYEDDILHLSDNLTAARFFGTTPEQMKNRFATDIGVPAANLQQWLDHYREALHTQAAVHFEYIHEAPSGQKWLSASVCPIGTGPNGYPRLSYIVEDISERKWAEEALQLSESRLKHLTASIPGTLYSYGHYPDGSGKFEYLSLGCQEMFEAEPARVIEDENVLLNQISPYDRPKHEEAVAHAVQNVLPFTSQWHNLAPSGKQTWLRVQAQPECREDGSIVWHGVILDITDRKQVEEKLKQAEHKYRTLIEQIPGVVYISPIAATTEQAYISPQLQQLLEISPEEWSPGFFNTWAEYVYPEDHERVLQAVNTAISTGKPLSVEYRMITRSGKMIWIRDRAHLVSSAGGQTEVLQGLAFDISDRKQMEQALQESNERFQLAASAVKGFIYDWDLKQNIVLRTQGLFEAVGYHPEEAEAKVDWWKEQVHPEDLANISQQLSEAFGSETQNNYVLEYRLRHRDGHYVYLSDYGTIARDPDGKAIRAVGHAIDVSDRREAEAALQKALQAAQAASIAKSRFLSNMSHELRTPLNAILGFSQVMVRSNSVSVEHKEHLQIINRSGEHLLSLINDILSMAKIEAGQTKLNGTRFDLYRLLDDLEQMLKLKATSKGLQLVFERASDIPQYVQTDENKLRQVLINLLGNAVKFTVAGYVALRVKRGKGLEQPHSQNQNSQTCLLFEIEDTGAGIASDEIGTLFNPFVQTETGRKSMQGTGLGLPISRQFVQMMGGIITVRSQVAKGTIFTFDVFVNEVAGADEKSLSSRQRVIGLAPNQQVYRMLVVEDVEENRQLLLKLLEPLGFQVREAVNGEEAIALWLTWKPHLIWMDMRMPVMDGYEATREIKALEQKSAGLQENNSSTLAGKTKIIALTASAFDEQQTNILAAGCDDFMHKPFREWQLFDKIAQHLGVRYIYEEDDQSDSPQLEAPRKLTPQDLSVMSPEWIAQLHQAILCADEALILKLIKQIPAAESSLAHTLTDLLNNFRLDLLFDLTQEFNHES
ncbi:MAG: PAS domain S-box protein [Microcoleus vaginatus WJT46-NPBG5]|jgi:PAS domain S-box-containing protein|nr:PAS domain S-box protein [Microcoleus vaginatus WJT46-NPBG5]